jgi:hypothetical protein
MLANRLLLKMLSCVLAVLTPAVAQCYVLISNNSPYSIWVTSYRDTGTWGEMAKAGAECVPGRTAQRVGPDLVRREFNVPKEKIQLRFEMTANANCQQPVLCDTTITPDPVPEKDSAGTYWFDFKSNWRGCWVELSKAGIRERDQYTGPVPTTFPAPPPPHCVGDCKRYLAVGQVLKSGAGQLLQSSDGRFYTIQQEDGNLCTYPGPYPAPDHTGALWCHMKTAPGGRFVTTLQADGNVCTYPGDVAAGSATWCTNKVTPGWAQVAGVAHDIGVGADGTAWVIGANAEVGGYGIYRYAGGWVKVEGSAVRIDVDPQGRAWVVTSGHAIFRFDGAKFVLVPGGQQANDIGIGAEGSVWVIGNDKPSPNDYSIYRLVGSTWKKVPGAAVRIDVDPKGNAWVVNSAHQIFRWNGSGWDNIPGAASDIGIGAEGSVYVTGTNNAIYKWNGSAWTSLPGGLANISAGRTGDPWGVNPSGAIYHAPASPSYVLVQQDDGNLCAYTGTNASDAHGAALWCHGSNLVRWSNW